MEYDRSSRDDRRALSGRRHRGIQPAVHRLQSSPVTDSFTVNWAGYSEPGTTITQYTLYFRYRDFAGATPGWQVWQPFPGTQLSAFYGLPEFTVQEGFYEFYATAKNNRNEVTPCVPTTGCQPPANPGQHHDRGSQRQAAVVLPARHFQQLRRIHSDLPGSARLPGRCLTLAVCRPSGTRTTTGQPGRTRPLPHPGRTLPAGMPVRRRPPPGRPLPR